MGELGFVNQMKKEMAMSECGVLAVVVWCGVWWCGLVLVWWWCGRTRELGFVTQMNVVV